MSKAELSGLVIQCSPLILLAWLAAYLLVNLLARKPTVRRFLFLSALCYGFVLLDMTLLGREPHEELRYQLELFWEYRLAFEFEAGRLTVENLEFLWYIRNNISLFVPLGVFLSEFLSAYRKNTIIMVLITGFLVSLLLETGQLVFRIGLFELDDILNNTIGAILGFCFYALTQRLRQISWLRKGS